MSRNLFIIVLLIITPFCGWGQVDTIADQKLQEVVIMAKLPTVEMKPGKMTYRLDASITQSQGNVYDVLTSLPGVVIQNDGTIFLNGQNGANILMDGKPTYLSGQDLVNLLKSTPASITDKIDLITHPSARYDASGNSGIIDIRTKKILRRGMNLSVNGSYDQGKYGEGFASTTLNLRTNKFNFYLSYSYSRKNDYDDLYVERSYLESWRPEGESGQMTQSSYRIWKNTSNYYRFGIDYQMSDKTTIGFSTDGNLAGNKVEGDMNSSIPKRSPQTGGSLRTLNDQNRSQDNFTAVLSLTHAFNSDGGVLDASMDYLRYRYEEDQYLNSQDTLFGDMGGGIHLYSGQVNLVWPFSKSFTFHAGAKTSFVSIENNADYNRLQGDSWQSDHDLSCDFQYDENINAGYVQLDAKFSSISLEAGLRLENTRIEGEQSGNAYQRDSSFTNHYTHLFPTLSVQYALRNGNRLSLTYGKRIVRPNYRDLNPFVYIHDEYTYDKGNTLLRPELSDNLELAYIHGDLFRVGLAFNYTKDVIIKSYLDQGNYVVYVSPENLSSCVSVGPRLSTSQLPLTSFWNVNVSASWIYNRYRLPENYQVKVIERWTPNIGISNQFNFARTWSAELIGFYNGKMAAGQATIYPLWQINVGIQKKIWKGRGTIQLFARDIFHSNVSRMSVMTPTQHAFIKERMNRTVVGISLTYRINRGLEVKESHRKHSVDESKRINL